MRAILFLSLCFTQFAFAQELQQYNSDRLRTDQRLMLTLGSWSAVNLVGSGIGWATAEEGEARYFHQMNVMWNTVNLGLALPGYIKARKTDPSMGLSQTIREQYLNEKVLLFNTGLDLVYISAGLVLRNEAKYHPNDQARFTGFGNSLLLQGGFLFLFDVTAHALHAQHRKKKLHPIMDRLSLSSTGIGLRYSIDAPGRVAIK